MKKYALILLVALALSATASANQVGNYQTQNANVIPCAYPGSYWMVSRILVIRCPIPSPCPPPNLCPPCPSPCPTPCPCPCPCPCPTPCRPWWWCCCPAPQSGCTADTTSDSVCIGGSGECYSQSTANSTAGGQCSSSSSSYSACLPPQTGNIIP